MNVMLTSDVTVQLIDRTGGDLRVALAAMVSTKGDAVAGMPARTMLQYDGQSFATVQVPAEEREPLDPAKLHGLINRLMEQRHGSPFEQGHMCLVVHAPIFVWREWHRHRVGFSYNEESGRYKKLDPIFWVPTRERAAMPVADPGDRCEFLYGDPVKATAPCGGDLRREEGGLKRCLKCGRNYRYHTSMAPHFGPMTSEEYSWFVLDSAKAAFADYERYETRLLRGYAKEVARSCLPVNIYSSCWVACNPRSLMHFLSLRTHEPTAKFVSHPQAEIEQAARVAEQVLREGWPITYEAYCRHGRVAP